MIITYLYQCRFMYDLLHLYSVVLSIRRKYEIKTIIIGKIYDPILDCSHASMKIETCYRDGSQIHLSDLQSELLEYEDKKVMITIEEFDKRG